MKHPTRFWGDLGDESPVRGTLLFLHNCQADLILCYLEALSFATDDFPAKDTGSGYFFLNSIFCFISQYITAF
jgi:hypothetical protein